MMGSTRLEGVVVVAAQGRGRERGGRGGGHGRRGAPREGGGGRDLEGRRWRLRCGRDERIRPRPWERRGGEGLSVTVVGGEDGGRRQLGGWD